MGLNVELYPSSNLLQYLIPGHFVISLKITSARLSALARWQSHSCKLACSLNPPLQHANSTHTYKICIYAHKNAQFLVRYHLRIHVPMFTKALRDKQIHLPNNGYTLSGLKVNRSVIKAQLRQWKTHIFFKQIHIYRLTWGQGGNCADCVYVVSIHPCGSFHFITVTTRPSSVNRQVNLVFWFISFLSLPPPPFLLSAGSIFIRVLPLS